MHRIHSAQWPTLAPRIFTQAPGRSRSFGMRNSALGCSLQAGIESLQGARASNSQVHIPRTQRRVARSARATTGRGSSSFCFEVAATAGVCRWVASTVRRRRLSTLARKAAAAAVQSEENLGTMVSPSVVTSADAAVTGVYDTIRSVESPAIPFVSVKTLGEDGISPAIGAEVWIRARVATVRVKGKSTFVVLRENSLYTVQACKFKDKEDGGESATAVSRFFKSIPLDPWFACVFKELDWTPLRNIPYVHAMHAIFDSCVRCAGKHCWSLWSSCGGIRLLLGPSEECLSKNKCLGTSWDEPWYCRW